LPYWFYFELSDLLSVRPILSNTIWYPSAP
jgi:hypothetical protein